MINKDRKPPEFIVLTKEILDKIPEDVKEQCESLREGEEEYKEFIDKLLNRSYAFTVYVYVPDTSRAGFGNDVEDFSDLTKEKCQRFIRFEQEKEAKHNLAEWKKYQLDYKYITTYSHRACRYKIGFKTL